jgi:hypothetical protein
MLGALCGALCGCEPPIKVLARWHESQKGPRAAQDAMDVLGWLECTILCQALCSAIREGGVGSREHVFWQMQKMFDCLAGDCSFDCPLGGS